jgi:hypothetical protein
LSESFLVSRTHRDTVINYIDLYVKYPLLLSDFNETLFFFYIFSKSAQISNLTKVNPVVAVLLRDDGRKDRRHVAKLIVAFRSFANAAKNANRDFQKSCRITKTTLVFVSGQDVAASAL